MIKLSTLKKNPDNPRSIRGEKFERLKRSLQTFPQMMSLRPIVTDSGGVVLGGNMRLEALKALGYKELPDEWVKKASELTDEQKREFVIKDNSNFGEYDWDLLANEWSDLPLADWGVDLPEDWLAPEGGKGEGESATLTLAERFIVPPFSVLDARAGYWQERKRAWLALGIQSELGRGDLLTWTSEQVTEPGLNYYRNRNAAPGGSLRDATTLGKDGKTVRGDGKGKPVKGLARCFGQDLMRGEHVVGERLTWVAGDRPVSELDETSRKNLAAQPQSGTSIFDPVLCELAYRWFSPDGGKVLDPFAGGSVRGVVAEKLNRRYTGIDLSERQLEANREQAERIGVGPVWVEGDSRDATTLAPGAYDFVFSCPPYADLERYSDDPRDLSTLSYADFLSAYREIIAACVGMLKDDRFCCFTVGDVRDRKGYYRNFVSDTIAAFQDVGARLYNEAILVTAVGSLPIRVGKQFSSGRKLGKTHQNVLVFVKGSAKKAAEACGPVEVYDLAEGYGEVLA